MRSRMAAGMLDAGVVMGRPCQINAALFLLPRYIPMSGKCNKLLMRFLSALLPSSTRFGSPAAAFPCVFGHMRRRHSSHNSASPEAEASVKAARFCAPRSGRSALTDAGAEGTSPRVPRANLTLLVALKRRRDAFAISIFSARPQG
jgi:hypothetical protein